MRRLSRRTYLKLTASIALAELTSIDSGFAQETPLVLRYGVQRGAFGSIKTALLDTEKKYDIKYDQKVFNDATAVILALQQRELDLGNVTAQHVVRAIDQEINLVVVCGLAGGSNVLVANPDINLKVADLGGFKALILDRKNSNKLKIGTPTGSMQHLKLISMLKSLNVDPDHDVEIVNVSFPEHVRALDGRQVDMAMTISSFASMAIVNGAGKLFYRLYGPGYGRWEIGLAVRRDLALEKPVIVQKIVGSHVDALNSFMGDTKKTIELELKDSSFPPKVVEMEQSQFRTYSYKISVEDIKRTAVEMYQVGWVNRDLSDQVEKYVDFRFLEAATGQARESLVGF